MTVIISVLPMADGSFANIYLLISTRPTSNTTALNISNAPGWALLADSSPAVSALVGGPSTPGSILFPSDSDPQPEGTQSPASGPALYTSGSAAPSPFNTATSDEGTAGDNGTFNRADLNRPDFMAHNQPETWQTGTHDLCLIDAQHSHCFDGCVKFPSEAVVADMLSRAKAEATLPARQPAHGYIPENSPRPRPACSQQKPHQVTPAYEPAQVFGSSQQAREQQQGRRRQQARE